jgi:fructose-bisphosphate aldolase, class I
MTDLGKAVRLARLRNPESGRILTIALDHAPSYGVLKGIENIREVLDTVVQAGPDAILTMKGVARQCFLPYAGRVGLILKSSMISPFHAERDTLVADVEDALRLGADAIAMALTVGSAEQAQLISDLGTLVQAAEQVGLPVIVHAYPCGEFIPAEERYTADRVGYAARLAMELGVDIVKTYYTGSADSFAQVVEMAAPALVVAAGGARLENDEEVLRMAGEVVQSGAAGITFGRNIWQSENITGLISALKTILHQDASANKAANNLASGKGS